jgi:uncharacterized protein (TIGR03067 family)
MGDNAMRTAALLLALVSVPALTAQDNKDLDALQGTWQRTSMIRNGKPVPEDEVKAERLTLQGEHYTLLIGDQKRTGIFRLDPSKSPRTLDIVSTEGPNKGKTLHAIYELEGDTFTYCVAPPGKERPTLLESRPGSGWTLLVNKRVRP